MPEIIETETQEISVMSLNGDGTQENPYQITTVAEFRSMNDSTAYFKLMNDLDVNDSEWATGWTAPTLACMEFDGNGKKIRNAICNNGFIITDSGKAKKFKNLTTENILVGSNDYAITSNSASAYFVNFTDCNLSFTGGLGFNRFNKFDGCAILLSNVNKSNDVNPMFKSVALERCIVKLDNCTLPQNSKGGLFDKGLYGDVAILNTAFLGNLKLSSNLISDGTNTIGLINGHPSDPFQRSYFAFTLDKNGYTIAEDYPFVSSYSTVNNSFYDAELMGHTFASKTGLSALTTEQCKDKDYLNSIGFTVV